MKPRTYLWLLFCLSFSIAIVLVLNLLAERNPNHQYNSFSRDFVGYTITRAKALPLGYNSYYFAGSTSNHIYLGNSALPLNLIITDIELNDTAHVRIRVPTLQYRSILLRVDSPTFALIDGTIPFIYSGNLSDLEGYKCLDSIYFINALRLSTKSFALIAVNNGENTLEKFAVENSNLRIFRGLLEKQVEGMFSTDGMLHYDKETARLLYLYFYRNEYLYMDTNFNILNKGNTIDTISHAKIKVAKSNSKNSFTMAAPPLIVNKHSYVSGNYLYNNSNLLARNENVDDFENQTVIDVYDLKKHEYMCSFYIPQYDGAKTSSFIVVNNKLVTIQGQNIVTYDLSLFK